MTQEELDMLVIVFAPIVAIARAQIRREQAESGAGVEESVLHLPARPVTDREEGPADLPLAA